MVIILNFPVWLVTLQKSNTMVSKDIKVVIINMISDVGQKLLYVLPTQSGIHLHIMCYNNTYITQQGIWQLFKL